MTGSPKDDKEEDGLDIPEYLKVENRVPLTPEQQAVLDQRMASYRAEKDKWQLRREQYREQQKEKARERVAKMLDDHPGQKWDPKKREWVPEE